MYYLDFVDDYSHNLFGCNSHLFDFVDSFDELVDYNIR